MSDDIPSAKETAIRLGKEKHHLLNDLRELADKWEDKAEPYLNPDDGNVTDSENGMALQKHFGAQELREVIEQYE